MNWVSAVALTSGMRNEKPIKLSMLHKVGSGQRAQAQPWPLQGFLLHVVTMKDRIYVNL